MLNIIFLLLAGSVFAYISETNLVPVTLNLAQYTFTDIPLFYVIMGSLIIGMVFSYILQILGSISNPFVLWGNKKQIKLGQAEVLELTKRIHQLELENEQLKNHTPFKNDANAL